MQGQRRFVFFVTLASLLNVASSLAVSPNIFPARLRDGYRQRVDADPSFGWKSLAEVILAAGTQFTAELERRGPDRIMPEIDFVVAGLLTAIYGKYSSMWRTAKTTDTLKKSMHEPHFGSLRVPSNAFQKYLLDGSTVPSLYQRAASFVVPIPALFRAGIWASAIGYGFTHILIKLRALLLPNYVAGTQNINILYACLYTGAFMATVSNLRYQLLQGLVEPFLDRMLQRYPYIRAITIFATRTLNGVLGSVLAISGMQILGLQKLK